MDGSGADCSEERLQNDLGQFLRRFKQRQEDHRKFFEYNNKISSRCNQIADQIFIHDEISKLRNYIHEKMATEQSQQELDIQICTRYEQLYSCADRVVLLMKRITSRVIQTAQLGLDSLKQHIQYYSLNFTRFKTACLRASSDNISCRPSHMVKIFSRYMQHKINIEAQRLREMTKYLELSDSESLQNLKQAYYRRLCLRELSNREHSSKELIQRSNSNSITSPKVVKKQVRSMQSEKQIRVRLTKHEERQRQKMRKFAIKRLKKYIHSLCEVMDVNKDQMLEDVLIVNKQSESRRIFNELSGRNKNNVSQISAYLQRAPELREIVGLDKNQEQKSQTNILQAQLFKKNGPLERINIQIPAEVFRMCKASPKNQKETTSRYSKRESFNGKSRSIYKKQRKTVNNAQEANLKQRQIFQTQKQLANEFVEINIKNQEYKQRFPQIYPRATSVDTVKIIKKEAHIKFMKDQRMPKDSYNQQITREGIQPSNQTFVSKKNLVDTINATVINSNIDKSKGRQKIETKIKLELKTTGFNFFQEIGKRISKFCEMKKNLVP